MHNNAHFKFRQELGISMVWNPLISTNILAWMEVSNINHCMYRSVRWRNTYSNRVLLFRTVLEESFHNHWPYRIDETWASESPSYYDNSFSLMYKTEEIELQRASLLIWTLFTSELMSGVFSYSITFFGGWLICTSWLSDKEFCVYFNTFTLRSWWYNERIGLIYFVIFIGFSLFYGS